MRPSILVAASVLAVAAPARAAEVLQYHPIRTDGAGMIVPWVSPDLGRSYDQVVELCWKFWREIRRDPNGLPYYMNHQVWQPDVNDRRGLGGDQINMALSSWALLFAYMGQAQGFHGNDPIRDDMMFMADYYLRHSLSPPNAAWPNIPYPYNTALYGGVYDGDMVLGRGYTQPDKAGSFGKELLTVYKITKHHVAENAHYLETAIAIADTLAAKVKPGDDAHSPLPFKVHAPTGKVGVLVEKGKTIQSSYTSNWAPTLEMFEELIRMGKGNVGAYRKAHDTLLAWMKQFPMKTNKWGPFFEDIDGWSDTQINAVTFAQYVMEHRDLFPAWREDVQRIFDWVYKELGNDQWKKYGVVAINEQTAYRVPGNSHTARQASAELRFAELTGDTARKAGAIRQLSWATYMVDKDGKNKYPRDEVWLTDGYGDYVRHYLRAMASAPELAPATEDHLLRSTSVVIDVRYEKTRLTYKTFEAPSRELARLTAKPTRVTVGGGKTPATLAEVPDIEAGQGWSWTPLGKKGGVLRVRHDRETQVTIER